MEPRLLQLLQKNDFKFRGWIEAINLYNETHSLNKEFSTDEMMQRSDNAANALAGISEMFFEYGAFKDKFDNSKMYLHFDGPCVIINSLKLGTVFHLGIGNKGLYLNTYLKHSENIGYMDDAFYKAIFSLEELGEFELVEWQSYGKETKAKYPGVFNSNKSLFFRLLRNYFIGTIEREGDVVLGDLQVSWTPKLDFPTIISNGCQTFKILYKLNYELWKVSDLATKKTQKDT